MTSIADMAGHHHHMDADINMPHGSTIGCHVSPTNGIFRGPYGPIEKCHVGPPREHHISVRQCQGSHVNIRGGDSKGAKWPNHGETCGIPGIPNVIT
jgi:hypothetical protein